jgi:surface protein
MSFGSLTNRLASQKNIRSKANPIVSWVRPSDWLELPVLSDLDQKFVGLHAIYRDSNFCAIIAQGNYTVDWGDGIVENFNSGIRAQHEYDFTTYDVTNTTLTSKGYKQAIVQVYPQEGQTLSQLLLNVKHLKTNLQLYSTGFLDISISSNALTSLTIGGTTVRMAVLENVLINKNNVTSMASLFSNCLNLKSIKLLNTTSVLNASAMFFACRTLESVPLFDTINVTNMGDMFNGCSALESVPLFNTINVTSMSNMFNGCSALASVPLFDTTNVTSMASMFTSCFALTSVPLFNTSKVTSMVSMFNGCYALESVPLFDTINVTSMASMFTNCFGLTSVPLFNTSSVTSMSSMFAGCAALESVPLFNTTRVTNTGFMFQSCSSLQSVPEFNKIATTTVTSMFSGCPQLAIIDIKNINAALQINLLKLSTNQINKVIDNLVGSTTSRALTISSNHGLDTAISKTGTLTANSPIVTMTDTSNIGVGMSVIAAAGMAYSSSKTISISSAGIASLTGHNLLEDTPFCFLTNHSFLFRVTTLSNAGAWRGIAYGAGRFVSFITNSSIINTSTDGITWTTGNFPVIAKWELLKYANGVFVAIANGTSISATSPDGITWTQRVLPISTNWVSIAFGNGIFVAIANGTSISATSPDGITWTQRALPIVANWQSIAFGNGIFVAIVGNNSNIAATSPDGINWTQRVLPISTNWVSMAFGNGIFVAVDQTNNTLISTDGINWEKGKLPASSLWKEIAYGGGLFAVGRSDASAVAVSSNGIEWTLESTNASQGYLTYGENFFISVPSNNGNSGNMFGPGVFNRNDTFYAKNVTANAFEITKTPGGASLVNSLGVVIASATIRVGVFVKEINPNVSITLSAPATTTSTSLALSIRPSINAGKALMKNWSIAF